MLAKAAAAAHEDFLKEINAMRTEPTTFATHLTPMTSQCVTLTPKHTHHPSSFSPK